MPKSELTLYYIGHLTGWLALIYFEAGTERCHHTGVRLTGKAHALCRRDNLKVPQNFIPKERHYSPSSIFHSPFLWLSVQG